MTIVSPQPALAELEYRVVGPLGNGAGSTILQITDKKLGRDFALKVVKRRDPDDDIYLNQAQHEFEVGQRLNHRAILKIHDCRVVRKWFRVTGVELLMEYVEGRNLDEVEAPPLDQLVLVFCEVASGLSHMHRRGVYHGDLKPSNIMLSKAAVVKIIDFGTAWIKGSPKDRVQGTPQYMAPEQVQDKTVNDRTDLYNFGATMYRLVTGEYANIGFPQSNNGDLGRRRPLVRAPIEINPHVPGTLNETILACLQPNPDRRPAGVHEVKHQLKAVARYLGVSKDELRGSEEMDD